MSLRSIVRYGVLLLAGIVPASAQDKVETVPTAYRQMIPDRKLICFGRVYDAAHLKKNPAQHITRMRLNFFASDRAKDAPDINIQFRFDVTRRTPALRYGAPGVCYTNEGKFYCRVECDTARFTLKAVGTSGMELTLQSGISTDGCGDRENSGMIDGPANRVVRLQRLPDAECEDRDKFNE